MDETHLRQPGGHDPGSDADHEPGGVGGSAGRRLGEDGGPIGLRVGRDPGNLGDEIPDDGDVTYPEVGGETPGM